ncbi:unnamed protein product [Arctia plantaginis]|uniref:RanBD1 domain-containing protein n=1 Tax=Arctia plantaginis TaxID=874455 RepID=A0A8S1ABB1_ARCPL|nr:unnamed protein product [Arctia plantaginis]
MADAKQGKSPIEDFFNGSSQSRSVLAKPRLGGFGSSSFASSSNKGSCSPFGSILRPSQLKTGANPFLKVTDTFGLSGAKANDKKEETPNDDRLKEKEAQEADAPKFVPLGSTNVTRISNAPGGQSAPSSSAGFVFGQNLSERVELKESANNGEASSTEDTMSNKSTELLFSSAAASVKENQEETNSSDVTSSNDGLAAAAAEYERSHARPPPPTTNITITGEEGEINVLQISCRLFAWEAGSWRERGRGVLRLNDAETGREGGARLVARVSGSLRVVLNTKLWPDMVVERAGTKSLRITAADALQQVKLFLIMGSPGDIAQLHRALMSRISVSKRTCSVSANTGTQNASSQKAAERLEADVDENDYLEKQDNKSEVKQAAAGSAVDEDVGDSESSNNDRLQTDNVHKTDQHESNVDDIKEDNEAKALKRKEPVGDESSPKRQCPEIFIE